MKKKTKKGFSFGIKRPGKLTEQAHREGKTVHRMAVEDKKSGDPTLVKEGTFALNAEKRFGKGKKPGTPRKGVPTKHDVWRAKRRPATVGTKKKTSRKRHRVK